MKNKIDERREKLFTTTRDLILEYGLHSTSMSMISKASGIAIGSIYNMFADKVKLINELYIRSRTITFDCYVNPRSQKKDPKEAFIENAHIYIETALKNKEDFLFIHQYHLSPIIDRSIKLNVDFKIFGDYKISDMIEKGVLKPIGYMALYSIVNGIIDNMLNLHFTDYLKLTDSLIDECVIACWDAIKLNN